MKKTTNTTEEKTLLKPFPLVENENYLLKMANGVNIYAVAVWNNGRFYTEFSNQYIEEEIESIVSLKELGL